MVEPIVAFLSRTFPVRSEPDPKTVPSESRTEFLADRFELSDQSVVFRHRLSFLNEQLSLDVDGRVSYSARSLELNVRVEAATELIEYNGNTYDVGRVEMNLRFTGIDVSVTDESFREQGDPLEIALELAQALNKIAGQKGRKRISLVFSSPEVFAKLAGIDGGRFVLQVVSLVRLIEQTAEWIYREDRSVNRYVVGIHDHVNAGVVRKLQVSTFDFSGAIEIATARSIADSATEPESVVKNGSIPPE